MVKRIFGTEASWAPLALRLGLGVIFFYHGGQKLFGWFGGPGFEATAGSFEEHLGLAPGKLWAGLAAGGEFVGGAAALLGAATRIAAVNFIAIMAVAVAMVHWKNGFGLQSQGFEYNYALIAMSAALLLTGGGNLSVDRLAAGKRP